MADNVPDSVRRSAQSAFDRRSPDARLAVLVDDVWLEDPRGERRLAFRCEELHVHVEVCPCPPSVTLGVALVPPAVVTVEVRHSGRTLRRLSGSDGKCELGLVKSGPMSLRLTGGVPATVTDWVGV